MKRVAVIGLGAVAERIHLPAIASVHSLQLVAGCDSDPARRERMRAKFSIAAVYDDAQAMLVREHPDLVVIGTPPALHAEHVLQALEAGAHVLCEKPFVETVEQADAVIAAAAASQRQVAVNNQYRYMRMYREPQRRLTDGEYGRLYFLHAWQQMYHPPSMERGWRSALRQSTLFEFGTHPLDLMLFFLADVPESVSAQTPCVREDIQADVLVLLQFRFPGERVATIHLNRLSHAPERYLEMRLECEKASIRISLGGVAEARVEWSRARQRPNLRASLVRGGEARLEHGGHSRRIAAEPRQAFASATATHLIEFVRDIEDGREPANSARHARTLIQIVHAAYESARSEQTVRFAWP